MASFGLALQEIEKFRRVFKAFEEAENALIMLASYEQNKQVLEKEHELLVVKIAKSKEEYATVIKQYEEENLFLVKQRQAEQEAANKNALEALVKQDMQLTIQKNSIVAEREVLISGNEKLKEDQEKLKQSTLCIEGDYITASRKLEAIRKQIASLMSVV